MPDTVYHSFCDTIFCNQTPFLTSTKPITHLIQSAILTHAKITTTNKPVNRLSTKAIGTLTIHTKTLSKRT